MTIPKFDLNAWLGHQHPSILFIIALIAGAIAPLALAPVNVSVMALISVAILAWLLRLAKPLNLGTTLGIGGAYGLGYFLCGVGWVYISIADNSPTPIVLAWILTLLFCMLMATFYVLFAYIYWHFIKNLDGLKQLILFSLVWVLLDVIRGVIFTGFPWLYLGYSGVNNWLHGYGPVLGQHGITFLLVLTSLFMLCINRHYYYGVLVIAIWCAGLGLSLVNWTEADNTQKVTLLQGNIALSEKWLPHKLAPTLDYYSRTTLDYLDSDLVLWPETATPTYWFYAKPLLDSLQEAADKADTTIITGVVTTNTGTFEGDIYNSLVAFGNTQGVYNKQRLVPFGEYVPLQSVLGPLLSLFNLPHDGFSLGDDKQTLLTQTPTAIAGNICYEIAYSGLVAQQAKKAQLLVTVSNDTWFGDSWAPWQHVQMAQMRALENGRPIARSTNSGVSALIDYQGNITAQAPLFTQHALTGYLQTRTGSTPFNYMMTNLLGWI